MLHHAHDRACNGRIPSSLLGTYVRYKQDTRAIISWLLSHATVSPGRQAVSVQDLFNLAQIVRGRAVEMPAYISYHFREAIAARKQLSSFFRKAAPHGDMDQDTLNHEYFTAR